MSRQQDTALQLKLERDRLQLLLDLNNSIVSNLDFRRLLRAISSSLHHVVQYDFATLALPDLQSGQLQLYALDNPKGKDLIQEDMLIPVEGSSPGAAFRTGKPLVLNNPEETRLGAAATGGVKSGCFLPLITRDRIIGTLNLGRLEEGAFVEEELDFLREVANQVALAVENALDYGQVTESRERLAEERLYLNEEIRTEENFEEIVGESPVLRRALGQVETVAPTDSTALILGETGTGKELVARAIHNLSARRDHTFVKVNCAAIPLGLLESELFGHEKGAFTGAIAQKIGRFELAHQGTLFLDEVGDIPLELQPKLLRVLQDQEFERLGSTRTIRANVRLVAATSRDLGQMIADGRFRSDLYYRLNVFPISVPPLRERLEDIPILVRHFAGVYARRMNKQIETIPATAMEALTRYSWPGNVRELENIIERAVIVSKGSKLEIPLDGLNGQMEPVSMRSGTLEAAERDYILRALQENNWIIGGPSGAAARLGMKRTTLQYRMKKLGIAAPK